MFTDSPNTQCSDRRGFEWQLPILLNFATARSRVARLNIGYRWLYCFATVKYLYILYLPILTIFTYLLSTVFAVLS
jgi:hypothetical protein